MATGTSKPTALTHQSWAQDDIAPVCAEYGITTFEFTELGVLSAAAKSTAYCPYSEFRVGATLLTASGEFVTGANVENASYPVGTCAERVAFGKAVTEGHRSGFRAVAVSTDISPPASPCGMCRQLLTQEAVDVARAGRSSIREFCDLKTPIIMFDKNGDYIIKRLEELLPMSFGPEALPPPTGQLRDTGGQTEVDQSS